MKKIVVIEGIVLVLLLAVALSVGLGSCSRREPPTENQQTGSATIPEPTEDVLAPLPTEPQETEPHWITFPEDRRLLAKQYFVYDVNENAFVQISGSVKEKIFPASITKLFTAYFAMQYLKPDRQVTVDNVLDLVAAGSSVAELRKGDVLTAEQLVEAMLLPSGNDAAYVLAEQAGRVIRKNPNLSPAAAVNTFVTAMNEKTKQLGMTGSHFANPDGIHRPNHYSTPEDLAMMAKLALENPTILKYARVHRETVNLGGEIKQWENTNALINPESPFYCPHALGLKTGQTPYAGSCLLSAFEYKGRQLVIGVFGCPKEEDRFADTMQLFNQTVGYQG